jgi:dihydrolipoamide dehydrogenase
LNWGCIPTKALLRMPKIARLVTEAARNSVSWAENVTLDYAAAVERSRKISARFGQGCRTVDEGQRY